MRRDGMARHEADRSDRPDWQDQMLTREDVGYGPVRPYEQDQFGRRQRNRRHGPRVAPSGAELAQRPLGEGPYHKRLLRKQRPDPWIRAEVEEELFYDTWIDADRIAVEVENGIVTLIGTLVNDREVEDAIGHAERVDGVRGVRNRLEVET